MPYPFIYINLSMKISILEWVMMKMKKTKQNKTKQKHIQHLNQNLCTKRGWLIYNSQIGGFGYIFG